MISLGGAGRLPPAALCLPIGVRQPGEKVWVVSRCSPRLPHPYALFGSFVVMVGAGQVGQGVAGAGNLPSHLPRPVAGRTSVCQIGVRQPGENIWVIHQRSPRLPHPYALLPCYNLFMPDQYDSHKHHRRSTRLRDWDYRSVGIYFITICTYQRQNLFDNPVWRELVENGWANTVNHPHAQHIVLDEWVVMPNHVHGILIIAANIIQPLAEIDVQPGLQNAASGSIGAIVGNFKSLMTRRINNLQHTPGGKVWQRGYYDRIVRNERELNATRQYIQDNPIRWAEDRENLDELVAKMRYVDIP